MWEGRGYTDGWGERGRGRGWNGRGLSERGRGLRGSHAPQPPWVSVSQRGWVRCAESAVGEGRAQHPWVGGVTPPWVGGEHGITTKTPLDVRSLWGMVTLGGVGVL